MNTTQLFTAVTLLISMHAASISAAQASDFNKDFQMRTIYEPAPYVLNREARGAVTIYDGFTSQEVDQVMDDHFHRIENMMFTRVVVTQPDGEVEVMDDGCD